MSTDTYKTERLIIRPWRESDKPAFATMNADTRVMEFFPQTYSRQRSDDAHLSALLD